MLKSSINLLCVLALFLFAACGLNRPVSIAIDNQDDIEIPANAALSIYMTPEELKKRYVSGVGGQFTLDEGKRIQSAAIKVFSKLFKEVAPSQDSRKVHLVAKINGTTKVSNFWGTYKADATVLLYSGNGTLIGEFTAKGSEISNYVIDGVALENAYVKAFEKISFQMLENEKLTKYFRNGFTDDLY